MTNFRRALLAILTFVGILASSLVVAPAIVSAHSAALTGVATCVDLKTNTYSVTWTVNPTEDRFQYSIDQAGWSPAGSNTWTGKVSNVYPNSTLTEAIPAATNPATKTAGVNWRDSGHTNPDFEANASGSVAKPANCPATPVTPAVTYTPPTCFAAGTVVTIPGTGYTFNAGNGQDPVTFTATALPGYSLTQSVFGPYAIASIIGTDPCKPSYDPTVVVVETPCTAGAVDVTITTTTHTYHAVFTNGVWIKTEDVGSPTVVVTHRALTDAEKITCKPTYDPKVEVVETPCTVGATQVTITTTTTTYHAEYQNGVWVKVADVPTVVVTHRLLTDAEKVTCKPSHEPKRTTVDDGTPKCGDTSVATTTTTTTYTYTYEFVNEVPAWVEHTTVVVTHGSRPVVTEACPTTTTTEPPTTTTVAVAVCAYDVSLPADSPLCVAPTTTTVAPATTVVIPVNTPLPRTGSNSGQGLLFGGIIVGIGAAATLVARRRKPRNA